MSLESIQFTQSSLQDYVDCPRRFQLRYVLNQPWPAVESEPLLERERLVELGRRFHQMAQRHAAGLPVEQIALSAQDPDLVRWWRNYTNVPPSDLPSTLRRAETTLSAPLVVSGGTSVGRIAAKYDLLALDPGRRAVIVDWKTERKRPTRKQLVERMQTRVYRDVLVEAGAALNGGQPVEPEQVTLVYWFAEFPAEPEALPYDAALHAEDAAFLGSLVQEIAGRAEAVWPLTDQPRRCNLCVYRSLCDRGVTAGASDEAEIEPDLDIDITEIQEIAY